MATEIAERERVWIVGGGVIGLACAFELTERGVPVTVVERERTGSGASRAAAGMLAPVAEAETEELPATRLALRSASLYADFVRRVEAASGLSCGYRREGSLWVAVDRDDAAVLDHLHRTLADKELPVSRLSPDELLRREPHLSSRVLGGLELQGDRQVDPRSLCAALVRALERRGADFLHGTEVLDARPSGEGGVELRIRDGGGERIRHAPRVLLAAGANSGRLLPALGVDARLRPVKGQLLRLRGETLLERVVRTPDVYLVPRSDGELLIGATVEEMGFDERPTAGAVLDLLRYAWRVLPGIYDLELAEISVGLRPALPETHPTIGAAAVEGAFVAIGHYRNGVLLAPATAVGVAERIVEGRTPEWLREFAPTLRAKGK